MCHRSPLLQPQAPASIQHLWSIPRAQQPGPPTPTAGKQPAAPSTPQPREMEAHGALQLSQRWAGSCPAAPFPQQRVRASRKRAGSGRSRASLRFVLPQPRAHTAPHVISCSFFAPPIISAQGSAHAAALPTSSCFSHLPRTPAVIPPRLSQLPEPAALAWRFGSCFPWTWLQPHAGKGEQPVMHRPCCSRTCFRSQSDLYAQSQGIPGPDCLHRVRRPTARAEGVPAPALGIIFFEELWASLCKGISDNEVRQKGRIKSRFL